MPTRHQREGQGHQVARQRGDAAVEARGQVALAFGHARVGGVGAFLAVVSQARSHAAQRVLGEDGAGQGVHHRGDGVEQGLEGARDADVGILQARHGSVSGATDAPTQRVEELAHLAWRGGGHAARVLLSLAA